MTTNQTCVWQGAFGRDYTYYIFPRGTKIVSGKCGNYIYARLSADNRWIPVHIGEGDLSVRCSNNHHQQQCLNIKGATHVHMHLNGDHQARWKEEADLLSRFTNSYAPSGCNIKPGG